jgi:hypothetical protein
MVSSLKQWFVRRPYTTTSLIFLAVLLFGWNALGWGERQLGFLLLLYFIITLGVRLDEISRTLGGGGGQPDGDPADTILARLSDIHSTLSDIRSALAKQAAREESEAGKNR